MNLDLPPWLDDRRRTDLAELAAHCETAYAERLLGLVLSGSAGRDFTTERSDLDVYVVLSERLPGDSGVAKSAEMDELPITLAELSQVPPYGTDGWWFRWSFAYAPILLDRSDGRLAAALRAQASVTDSEALAILTDHDRFDGWLNYAYRALKSERDGRLLEAHLDTVESLPWLLDLIFTLAGRVRPYNKYLAWELDHHPLPEWPGGRLLDLVQATLDGDTSALRATFAHLEPLCRRWEAAQHSTALSDLTAAWGDELDLLRR